MTEEIDDAVKRLMTRLLKTTADNFDLAFARYETTERESALAHARRLIESGDPAERELGERLKAEVLKDTGQVHISSTTVDARVVVEEPSKVAASQQLTSDLTPPSPNGAPTNPLSRRSSLPSPAADSKSAAASQDPPAKRGPGRPRKYPDSLPQPKGKRAPKE